MNILPAPGFARCFGGIHVHDASAAQSIPTGTTYTKLTCFTDNNDSSNMTPDAANDKITITVAGYYAVVGAFQFQCGTNNVVWRLSPFLAGVEQDSIHVKRKIGTAGDVGSTCMTGIIDVTSAPMDLDVRTRHDNAGSVDITVEYANLTLFYLGPT